MPGFRKIELPGMIASAIEQLNPTTDRDIKKLCMLLDPDVFQTIDEFISDPSEQREVLEEIHYRFLDLYVDSGNDFYDRLCHSFFYETRRVFQASAAYLNKQKEEGGQK